MFANYSLTAQEFTECITALQNGFKIKKIPATAGLTDNYVIVEVDRTTGAARKYTDEIIPNSSGKNYWVIPMPAANAGNEASTFPFLIRAPVDDDELRLIYNYPLCILHEGKYYISNFIHVRNTEAWKFVTALDAQTIILGSNDIIYFRMWPTMTFADTSKIQLTPTSQFPALYTQGASNNALAAKVLKDTYNVTLTTTNTDTPIIT